MSAPEPETVTITDHNVTTFDANPQTFDGDELSDDERMRKLERSTRAECAVAYHLNGELNENQGDGDDGGYDVRLPNGETIDVKSTHYKTGRLLIPAYQIAAHGGLRADYYVLAITPKDSADVRIVGYLTGREMENRPTLDWNKAPCKMAEQTELRDVSELLV